MEDSKEQALQSRVQKLQDKIPNKLKIHLNMQSGVATWESGVATSRQETASSTLQLGVATWETGVATSRHETASSNLQLGVATWESGVATARHETASSFFADSSSLNLFCYKTSLLPSLVPSLP